MIRTAHRRALGIALAGFALLPAGYAAAEEPVEAAVRNLVSTIDASPDWVAGFGELSYDAATQTATIKNLSVRSEKLATKLELTFGTVTIAGYGEAADGSFKATEIRATDGRLLGGDVFDVHMADMDLKGLAVPSFKDFVFDETKVATSAVRLFTRLAKTQIDSLDSGVVTVDQTYQGQKSHISMGSYSMSGMKDGLVDKAVVSNIVEETPSPDGLVKMRIESIEMRKYDYGAFSAAFDPDLAPTSSDWRVALALEAYRNWSIDIPGGEVRIGSFELENFKIRRPANNPLPLFDAIIANPTMPEDEMGKQLLEYLPGLLDSFAFGAFRLSDLDVVAPEIDRFHLGDFHLTDFSLQGLGEIGIGDLDVAVPGKGSLGAERVAVGGFRFPSVDKIIAATKAQQAGLEVDPLPLVPTMGFGEAINVDLVNAGKKLGAIDRARLDLSDYIGPVPTSIGVDLRGLDLDLSLVDDPQARKMLTELGYDRLQADYGFKLHWREADESVNLDGFKLAIKDVGSISADVALAGLKRSFIDDPKTIEQALPGLVFTRGKVLVQDGSVVDRAIGMEAKKKNQTPEKYRQDIAGALPLTLMLVLKNPGFQQKLAPALQAFIRTPGTLTLTAAPATPVPLVAILAAAQDNPRSLPDLLSLEVQAGK